MHGSAILPTSTTKKRKIIRCLSSLSLLYFSPLYLSLSLSISACICVSQLYDQRKEVVGIYLIVIQSQYGKLILSKRLQLGMARANSQPKYDAITASRFSENNHSRSVIMTKGLLEYTMLKLFLDQLQCKIRYWSIGATLFWLNRLL